MKRSTSADRERALLLRIFDESYDKTAWHGPNLKSALRRVPVEEAVWRPRPGRRNIAEIALHCAYWKYAVRRRITGAKRGSFPLKGSNWFELPAKLTSTQWRQYLSLLDEQHRELRELIASADRSRIIAAGHIAKHVYGAAMHDTYHAGQVRTLKSLFKQATTR